MRSKWIKRMTAMAAGLFIALIGLATVIAPARADVQDETAQGTTVDQSQSPLTLTASGAQTGDKSSIVQLNWNPPETTKKITGYTVESADFTVGLRRHMLGPKATSFTKTCKPGTTLYFRVRAHTTAGPLAWSQVLTVTAP